MKHMQVFLFALMSIPGFTQGMDVEVVQEEGKALPEQEQKRVLEGDECEDTSSSDPATKRSRASLHAAAEKGDVDEVQSLLSAKVSTETSDHFGHTPLHRAASQGHFACVKLLLQQQANCLAEGFNGETPLQAASVNRHPDCAAVIKEAQLLSICRKLWQQKHSNGNTALHIAAMEGRVDHVRGLLAIRAPVDVRDRKCWTALHHAAARGKCDVIELLLAAGLPINSCSNENEQTAFHIAAAAGQQGSVQALLRAKAAIEQTDRVGNTPLHYAVATEKGFAAVSTLLEAGADACALNENGNTPLAVAQIYKRLESIQILEQHERKKHIAPNHTTEDLSIKVVLKDGTVTITPRQVRISRTLKDLVSQVKESVVTGGDVQQSAVYEITLSSVSLAPWNHIFSLVYTEGNLSPLEVLCGESEIDAQHKRHFENEVRKQIDTLTFEEFGNVLWTANYLDIRPLSVLMAEAYAKKLFNKHTEGQSQESIQTAVHILRCFKQQALPKPK